MAGNGRARRGPRRLTFPLELVVVAAIVAAALLASATVTMYAFGVRGELWPPWPFG